MASARRAIATHLDLAIALAVGALYLVEIATTHTFAGDRALSIPAALAFAAALTLRTRAPVVPMLAGLGIIVLSNEAAPALAETGSFLFGFILAIYSAGRHARGRQTLACAVIALAAIPSAAIEPGQPLAIGDVVFFIMFLAGPFAAGRIVRLRHERAQAAEGRAAEAESQRDVAIAEERTRIARELHDVVAHAISVIVLQARGGRRMLDDDPEDTRAALDAIEHAGEQALTEMRRLLGMLRQADDELALAPQPSLARLPDLAAAVRATGLPLDVTIEGGGEHPAEARAAKPRAGGRIRLRVGRGSSRRLIGVPRRDDPLGRTHAPGVLEQLGELHRVHLRQPHENVRVAVVMRRGEEHGGLALQQRLALAEIGHAQHERVGVGPQPAHALAAHAQRRRAKRRSDLDARKPRADLDDVLPRGHRATVASAAWIATGCAPSRNR